MIFTDLEWWIFYAIGIAVFIWGFIFFKKNRYKRYTSAQLFGFLFAVMFVWYLPVEIKGSTVAEGIFSAILQGINVIKIGGYKAPDIDAGVGISLTYRISILVVRVVMLLNTYFAVVAFFGKPYARLMSFIKRNQDTYIFSSLNDKTLALACDIYQQNRRKDASKKIRLLFFSLDAVDKYKKPSDESLSFKKKLSDIGAIIFDECDIIGEFKKAVNFKKKTEVFLFDDDSRNIEVYKSICEIEKAANIKIFLEIKDSSWKEIKKISNSIKVNTSEIKTNFIWSSENFAYNNALNLARDNELFSNAYSMNTGDDRRKIIHALIVGMNEVSLEIMKTFLWMCQMPGYKLKITVIEDGNYLERFRFAAPGIVDAVDEPGLAVYEIQHYDKVDFISRNFREIIEKNSDFTYAFINTGNDGVNEEIAASLKTIKARSAQAKKCLIQVRLNKNDKNFKEKLGASDKENDTSAKDITIRQLGSLEELYSYESIVSSHIERAAKKYHNMKHVDDGKTWDSYYSDELNRKSTYSRIIAIINKLILLDYDFEKLEKDNEWVAAEHMRWAVFMWCLGYVYGNEKDDDKLTRPTLIPFDELKDDIKAGDRIILTEKNVSDIKTP